MSVKLTLAIPIELEEEIEKLTRGRYRSKQEFILECVREKLIDKNKKQEAEK